MIILAALLKRSHGIGINGGLIVHDPYDLMIFQGRTMGNTVIMGRRTWESLPHCPLPGRTNIVITKTPISGVPCYPSLQEAVASVTQGSVFVIGGSRLYQEAMPLASRLLLTEFDFSPQPEPAADTFFPEIPEGWSCHVLGTKVRGNYTLRFLDYTRATPKRHDQLLLTGCDSYSTITRVSPDRAYVVDGNACVANCVFVSRVGGVSFFKEVK